MPVPARPREGHSVPQALNPSEPQRPTRPRSNLRRYALTKPTGQRFSSMPDKISGEPPQRGRNSTAQGNALGTRFRMSIEALKGRDSFDCASGYAPFMSAAVKPGRNSCREYIVCLPLRHRWMAPWVELPTSGRAERGAAGCGPLKRPAGGGERSIEDAAGLQLVGNSGELGVSQR